MLLATDTQRPGTYCCQRSWSIFLEGHALRNVGGRLGAIIEPTVVDYDTGRCTTSILRSLYCTTARPSQWSLA